MTNSSNADFIHLARGCWSGSEVITIDPSNQLTVEASGSFENLPALAGCGMKSSYQQQSQAAHANACETIFRFADDGSVVMVWFPADGEPRIMHGQREGAIVTVARTDDDGTTHTLRSDYSRSGEMRTEMHISHPERAAFVAFVGDYRRQSAESEGESRP